MLLWLFRVAFPTLPRPLSSFAAPSCVAPASRFPLPAPSESLLAVPVCPPASPPSIPGEGDFSRASMEQYPGTGKGRGGKGFQQRRALGRGKTICSHGRARGSREGGCYQPLQHPPRPRREPIDTLRPRERRCVGKALRRLLETLHFGALFERLLGVKLVQGPSLAGCAARPLPPPPPSPPACSCPSGPFPAWPHLSPPSRPAAGIALSSPPTKRSVTGKIKPFSQCLH